MSWFRVEDSVYDHPKMVALDDGPCRGDAIALWVLSGSWVRRWNLEGFIPHAQVKRFAFKPKAAEELVRVGLWEDAPDGYRFHDWLDRNPTRAKEEDGRAKTNARVKAHRKRRSNARVTPLHMARVTHGETPPVTRDVTGPVTALHAGDVTLDVTPRVGSQGSDQDLLLRSSASQGDPAEIAEVVAVSDRARTATTTTAKRTSQKLTTDREEAAEVVRANGKLTSKAVAAEWHRVGKAAWQALGCKGVLFQPLEHHRRHFEAIVAALGQLSEPHASLRDLLEYFWNAPHGPVRSGRVPNPTPQLLVEGMTRDLVEALAWKSGSGVARATGNGSSTALRPEHQPYPALEEIPK
jgi:hypothetical protein